MDEKNPDPASAMTNGHPVQVPMTGDASPPPEPASSRVAGAAQLKRGSLKERVFKASAWVIIGVGVSQVLRFGGNIILARLLAPEHFGLMMMIGVVLQGVQMFSDVGLRVSVVRHAEGDEEGFVNTAWTIQVIRGFFLWIATCLLAWPVATLYGEPRLIAIIPIIGLNTVTAGFASTATFTLTRHVEYGRQIRMQLTGQVLTLTIMAVWAWQWPSVWALVAGSMFNGLYLTVASYFLIPGYRNRFAWDRAAAQEIFRFGRWVLLSTLMQFLLLQGDKAVMGKIMTTEQVGVFAIAALMSESILHILRRMSHDILLPVFSRLIDRGDREHFRRKTFQLRAVLLSLALPPLWAVAIWAQPIVDLLYPEAFSEAGWMLRILAVGSVGSVVMLSTERVTAAQGDSFRGMVAQVLRAILLIGCMAAGYAVGQVPGLLIGVSASRIMDYPILVWTIKRYDAWMPKLDFTAFAVSALVLWAGITYFG